jgi:hypothetical protein
MVVCDQEAVCPSHRRDNRRVLLPRLSHISGSVGSDGRQTTGRPIATAPSMRRPALEIGPPEMASFPKSASRSASNQIHGTICTPAEPLKNKWDVTMALDAEEWC